MGAGEQGCHLSVHGIRFMTFLTETMAVKWKRTVSRHTLFKFYSYSLILYSKLLPAAHKLQALQRAAPIWSCFGKQEIWLSCLPSAFNKLHKYFNNTPMCPNHDNFLNSLKCYNSFKNKVECFFKKKIGTNLFVLVAAVS